MGFLGQFAPSHFYKATERTTMFFFEKKSYMLYSYMLFYIHKFIWTGGQKSHKRQQRQNLIWDKSLINI